MAPPRATVHTFFQSGASAVLNIALVFFLLAGPPALAGDNTLAPQRVIPRGTGVLLLPALDATRDAAHMQAPRQLVVRHRAQYEFITRQFKVLGEEMASKTAETAPAMNLEDLSARTAGSLDLLAKRAGADWVVSPVVEEAKLDAFAGDEFKARTRIRLQVWDVRRHGWLAQTAFTGEASGRGSPVFVFKNSLDNAVKDSLRNLLGSYPPVVAVLQEDSLTDYLAGQTVPFVGDPARPFSGLQVKQ